MGLRFSEKINLNRSILNALRLKLVDKETPILAWPGKTYVNTHPAEQSLMGSVGHLPNPDFTGFQSPNSMGMVLLVEPNKEGLISLDISGRFDLFHLIIPEYDVMREQLIKDEEGVPKESQRLAVTNRRVTIEFPAIRLTINVPNSAHRWHTPPDVNPLRDVMQGLEGKLLEDPLVFKRLRKRDNGAPILFFDWDDNAIIDQESLNQAVISGMFENTTEVLPYQVGIRARARPAPSTLAEADNLYLVEIFIENSTPQDDARAFGVVKSAHLLDVQLETKISQGNARGLPHRLAPADYRFKGQNTVPGYGVTTSIVEIAHNHFATDAMPVYELEKVDNPDPETLGMTERPSFEALASNPIPILKGLIAAVDQYAVDWQANIERLIDEGDEHEADVSAKERETLIQERENMNGGVELLETHPHLLECFQWMNEAMQKAFIQQQKSEINTWRLFQLGFILTQIRAVYERCCDTDELTEHLETAEVLWFSTGGGKTESYLGIIVMALLYERLKGRLYGVCAWMKFPLRMLSVQQFQRLSYVVAQANIIRERESERMPGHPFTVGYFTGEGTPRNITSSYESDSKTFLPTLTSTQLNQWRFITDCPYCEAERSVEMQCDLGNGRIKHVCTNEQCWSNTTASAGEHGEGSRGDLGIMVSDEEVYRYMPSVLVGTIDKLATIAHNTKYRYFFGGGTHYCPQHGFSFEGSCVHNSLVQKDDGSYASEKCRNSTRSRPTKTIALKPMAYPGISFVIQDELHLLSENTGNFDAHYETLMSSIQEANGGRKPKILSATATIKGYAHHIHHLYQRQARRFPVPGYQRGESFYSRIDKEDEETLVRRFYAGILPLGTGAVLERASAIVSMRFLVLIDELRKGLKNDSAATAQSLGFTESQAGDLIVHLEQNLNSCLIYINSIRGTSNVNRHLEEQQSTVYPDWRWRQLDSKTSLDDIQDAIRLIETKAPDNPTRQLIATSVVSHGVDMGRLNFMVVGGWPKSIAEYMQSSARAGRVQPGIVLSIMNSKNLFQSNVFLNFQDYHRFMDRMVETVPVNRFAPNLLERTLPGIISACLNAWAAGQPWGVSINKNGGKLREALSATELGVRAAIKTQIMLALSVPKDLVDKGVFDPRVVADFQKQLKREVDLTLNRLENMPRQLSDLYISEVIERTMGNRPMYSLRDIESQVDVKPWSNEGALLLGALARNE
jgi:hypothetical protein